MALVHQVQKYEQVNKRDKYTCSNASLFWIIYTQGMMGVAKGQVPLQVIPEVYVKGMQTTVGRLILDYMGPFTGEDIFSCLKKKKVALIYCTYCCFQTVTSINHLMFVR